MLPSSIAEIKALYYSLLMFETIHTLLELRYSTSPCSSVVGAAAVAGVVAGVVAVVGEADGLAKNWLAKLEGIFQNGKGQTFDSIHCLVSDIAKDFAKLRLLAKEKIKVGVVGEIYIKYSALGNNYLESETVSLNGILKMGVKEQ